MALRRSARLDKKNGRAAYAAGQVWYAASFELYESGASVHPPEVLLLENAFHEAIAKCSEEEQLQVRRDLDDFFYPPQEGEEDLIGLEEAQDAAYGFQAWEAGEIDDDGNPVE